MSRWEMNVEFDIAESGIFPLTTNELLDLLPADERDETLASLLDLRLGYTSFTESLQPRKPSFEKSARRQKSLSGGTTRPSA